MRLNKPHINSSNAHKKLPTNRDNRITAVYVGLEGMQGLNYG